MNDPADLDPPFYDEPRLAPQKPAGKPREVWFAELTLWIWTVWACVFGIYETWKQIPDIETALNDQLQGLVLINPDTMMQWTIIGYVLLAMVSGWFVWKIGQGKHWSRSSFMWGFVFQVLMMLAPPYHEQASEYLADIPDLGLQIMALYWLYAWPGRGWFTKPSLLKKRA